MNNQTINNQTLNNQYLYSNNTNLLNVNEANNGKVPKNSVNYTRNSTTALNSSYASHNDRIQHS